jgi:thiosulfate/3-mercaptopyruvate sulfurtransferase
MSTLSSKNSDLLIETHSLAFRLGDPELRIIDIRDSEAYANGHIFGAHNVSDLRLKSTEAPLYMLEIQNFVSLLEQLKISNSTDVVIYDDNKSLSASRMWWVLNYHGHTQVRILNGGLVKWCVENRSLELGPSSLPSKQKIFKPNIQSPLLATLDTLMANYDRPGNIVWDIRSSDEFTGANNRGNLRSGHIPGAVHLEWSELIEESDHSFKDLDVLKNLLAVKGITPDKAIHIY